MILIDGFLLGNNQLEYIEIIIKRFELSQQAGGSIIAFGSIVPEFTVNTVSLIGSKDHSVLGLSTIIGSGCFGKIYTDFTLCLCVVAFTAGWYWHSLKFQYKTVIFDICLYVGCLIYIIFSLRDYKITFVESIILVLITPIFVFYNFWIRGKQNTNTET